MSAAVHAGIQISGCAPDSVCVPVTRAKRSTPTKSACSMAMTPAAANICSG